MDAENQTPVNKSSRCFQLLSHFSCPNMAWILVWFYLSLFGLEAISKQYEAQFHFISVSSDIYLFPVGLTYFQNTKKSTVYGKLFYPRFWLFNIMEKSSSHFLLPESDTLRNF